MINEFDAQQKKKLYVKAFKDEIAGEIIRERERREQELMQKMIYLPQQAIDTITDHTFALSNILGEYPRLKSRHSDLTEEHCPYWYPQEPLKVVGCMGTVSTGLMILALLLVPNIMENLGLAVAALAWAAVLAFYADVGLLLALVGGVLLTVGQMWLLAEQFSHPLMGGLPLMGVFLAVWKIWERKEKRAVAGFRAREAMWMEEHRRKLEALESEMEREWAAVLRRCDDCSARVCGQLGIPVDGDAINVAELVREEIAERYR